jgi:uncharacterized protein
LENIRISPNLPCIISETQIFIGAAMKRDSIKELIKWRDHPLRKPLLLRGARQVGKSWLIEEFGKQFSSMVTINFEKDKNAAALFQSSFKVSDIVS